MENQGAIALSPPDAETRSRIILKRSWDSYGKLVEINGRLKYPLGGIDVFKFTEGSARAVFRQMAALIWAIFIDTFQQLVSHQKA